MRYLALTLVLLAAGGAAQAATTATFVIVEGPRAGIKLNVGTDGTAGNGALDALGSIVVDGRCAGPSYHGPIGGQPDPDPDGCGWGRVLLLSAATPLVQNLAGAIDYEEGSIVEGTPGFGRHLAAVREYLNGVEREARKAAAKGTLSRSARARLETLVAEVRELDYRWEDTRDPKWIRQALVKKRAALALVMAAGLKVSESGSVAPPACKGASSIERRADCFKIDFWDVNVPLSVKSVLCDFRSGGRTISGKRPLFPGVEQSLKCSVTGATRVVDGVRKRVVHAELKLTVPPGAKTFAPKQVRVAVHWPA